MVFSRCPAPLRCREATVQLPVSAAGRWREGRFSAHDCRRGSFLSTSRIRSCFVVLLRCSQVSSERACDHWFNVWFMGWGCGTFHWSVLQPSVRLWEKENVQNSESTHFMGSKGGRTAEQLNSTWLLFVCLPCGFFFSPLSCSRLAPWRGVLLQHTVFHKR